jgi:hypothetical protein
VVSSPPPVVAQPAQPIRPANACQGVLPSACIDQIVAQARRVAPTACVAPRAMCGTRCVDTNTSASNCGACGNRCHSDQACNAGRCVAASAEEACYARGGTLFLAGQCITGATPAVRAVNHRVDGIEERVRVLEARPVGTTGTAIPAPAVASPDASMMRRLAILEGNDRLHTLWEVWEVANRSVVECRALSSDQDDWRSNCSTRLNEQERAFQEYTCSAQTHGMLPARGTSAAAGLPGYCARYLPPPSQSGGGGSDVSLAAGSPDGVPSAVREP